MSAALCPRWGLVKGARDSFQKGRSDRTFPVGTPRVAVASLICLPPRCCSTPRKGFAAVRWDDPRDSNGDVHRRVRSVVARSRSEDQPLELADRAAAEPQCGLEALLAELAGIEAAAQLVEGRPVLLLDLVARGLDQDQ